MEELFPDPPHDAEAFARLVAAGWVPVHHGRGLRGCWVKSGDGRIVGTREALQTLGRQPAEGTS